jgi:hypothetical protein
MLAVLSPAQLRAQPPMIDARAEADRKGAALSDSVRVTLTLEGPAPLVVELPKQLLTADADQAWRIRPEGDAARTPLTNGRERWVQTYRLDPYTVGAPLRATFNPVRVNGRPVTWPAVEVVVRKTVGEVDPASAASKTQVTGVEDPPAPPPPPPRASPWPWVAGAVALVVLAAGVAAWRLAGRPKPVPPGEWALAALAKLEAGDAATPQARAEVVERVAMILRTFVERKFAIPATKLTTAELAAAAGEQGWPVEQADPLRVLLEESDRAKFAGDVPDDDRCRGLVRDAVDWVHDVCRPVAQPR